MSVFVMRLESHSGKVGHCTLQLQRGRDGVSERWSARREPTWAACSSADWREFHLSCDLIDSLFQSLSVVEVLCVRALHHFRFAFDQSLDDPFHVDLTVYRLRQRRATFRICLISLERVVKIGQEGIH